MIGYAAILFALAATGLAAFFYLKAFWAPSSHDKGKDSRERKGRLFYRLSAGMILLAAGYLYYLILSDNFRYFYVFGYSAREQAFIYKISAFWAGQEGSYLLWAVFHAGFGLLLSGKKAPLALGTHCILQLFLLVLLLVKSPFRVLMQVPPDGIGLNPLLQDPWMAVHPPVVFIGYAALALPFAWAIQGLVSRQHKEIARECLSWTLFAWASLGAGIFIGGFWAYKVLGWGGYWAWDPVENSSLVPWLAAGVLLHLLLLARVKETALPAVYLTAILNFVLVLYGTFLTRSGVLSNFSTHSFSDEGGSGFLLGILLLTAAGGLAVWFWRWPSLPDGPLFGSFCSREFSLLAAALVLAAIGLIVLIGMSTPLITMAMGNPGSVGVSFYNAACLPLAALLMLLLAVGSSLIWGENSWHTLWRRWWLLPIVLAGGAWAMTSHISTPAAVVTAGLAAAALAATGLAVREKRLSRPAGLTHAGVAAALIGILFSSLAGQSVLVTFAAGQRQEVLGTGLTYLGKQAAEDGRGFYQEFKLDEPSNAVIQAYTKQNKAGRVAAREPGIYRGLTADLYAAPLMRATSPKPEKVQVEISRKPLINLVWLGACLIVLGTGWAAFIRRRGG